MRQLSVNVTPPVTLGGITRPMRHTEIVNARSALFDLYGDHLLARDGWAPVAGLVELLGAVQINPPAVRTAVSRMTREGWLAAGERSGTRGYATTPRATRRLTDAWTRIYAAEPRPWDGTWDVVVLEQLADRSRRSRTAATLEFLGYARLSGQTWVAPHASPELPEALDGVRYDHLVGARLADEPRALVARLWDLTGLTTAHREFLRWSDAQVDSLGTTPTLRASYAVRTQLVHEWRKFLFRDPALPTDLLPADWAGTRAAKQFGRVAQELGPAAGRYVTDCLNQVEA